MSTTPSPVIPLGLTLTTGDVISLQSDDGTYWTRVGQAIQTVKTTLEPECAFTVTVHENGRIVLQANDGHYLSPAGQAGQALQATKTTVSPDCYFTVSVFDRGTIALLADNKLYVSRYYTGSELISAVKPAIDQYCIFRVLQRKG